MMYGYDLDGKPFDNFLDAAMLMDDLARRQVARTMHGKYGVSSAWLVIIPFYETMVVGPDIEAFYRTETRVACQRAHDVWSEYIRWRSLGRSKRIAYQKMLAAHSTPHPAPAKPSCHRRGWR